MPDGTNHVDLGFVTGSCVGRDWLWNQESTGLAGPLSAHLGVGGSHGFPMVL